MKKVALALLCCLLALAFTGCTRTPAQTEEEPTLPAWAEEEPLAQQAREVVELINAQDFDAVAALSEEAFTGDQLREVFGGSLESFGAFDSLGDSVCEDATENGIEFVTVRQEAHYETSTVIYNMSFSEGNVLRGLWL
ncbi:MAG: hypothetical protein LBB46_06250 [Coriobacteriaceae bacterium]|jgi:hypothetical protein|nr:hypothetical protein [Coriobacteriaceae bacterium]